MMARIRTIKPEFWSSEQVMDCSPLSRLLFIGLWNFCDDAGNHPASAKTIKALVLPGDDVTVADVHGMLDELAANGLLAFYEAEGKRYLHVLGWSHQKIDRPTIKYPAYEPGVEEEISPAAAPAKTAHEAGSPFEMTLDWQPDETLLAAYAFKAGIPRTAFTGETMAGFICHHDAKGQSRTEKEWVAALVGWIKRDHVRDARVVPLPQRPSKGPDFHSDDTSWANDLGVL